MTEERDVWIEAGEPSTEEFAAAEMERPPAGWKNAVRRILRLLGVLLLIFALLLYFVAPFRSVFLGVVHEWNLNAPRLQSIPLAPERRTPGPHLAPVSGPPKLG